MVLFGLFPCLLGDIACRISYGGSIVYSFVWRDRHYISVLSVHLSGPADYPRGEFGEYMHRTFPVSCFWRCEKLEIIGNH